MCVHRQIGCVRCPKGACHGAETVFKARGANRNAIPHLAHTTPHTMDSDMHIASYPQLQLIQRQHLLRVQQHANAPARPRASSLLLSPVASAWRASNAAAGLTFPSPPVGAPAHGTVGTYADLASHGNLPAGTCSPILLPRIHANLCAGASLAQRGGNRVDPLFNPQNTSNVYINGLPTYFPTSQLYDLCAEFGPIASVRTFDRLNTPEPS